MKKFKNILMIGLSVSILKKFKEREDVNFFVIEEEEIYKKNKLDECKNPVIKKVVLAKYLESEEFIDIAKKINEEVRLDGVLPARDYAVKATAKVAEILGLPGIGERNGQILTNKCKLRESCERYDIPHPRYKKVSNKKDVYDFYKGKPLIFKPATLQASIGISKINSKNDIQLAWERTTTAQDAYVNTVSRQLLREYIVEEYIGGQEYSMETLVKNSEILFNNITQKKIFGDTFVEQGHIVPANLPESTKSKLIKETKNIVDKLEIKSALLHSEWKLENDIPYLIECAGRVPGDYIYDLIGLSYGFEFIDTYARIMSNDDFIINQKSIKVSCIYFFNTEEGILKEIEGLESLFMPEVVDWSINKCIGEKIEQINSSWDRIGYFIVSADDYETLDRVSKDILDTIKFIVE